MPLLTTIKRSDEKLLHGIYVKRSRKTLMNYIIERKFQHKTSLSLVDLLKMKKEQLIQELIKLHKTKESVR